MQGVQLLDWGLGTAPVFSPFLAAAGGLSHEEKQATSGQCHLNKENVSKALLFKSKALLPRSLAMEAGRGAFNDTRIKTEAAWRQEGGGFSQVREQMLPPAGKFLMGDQGKRRAGSVQHCDGMRPR